MSLLLAALLYGGVFTGYVFNDKVVQPYIQQQVEQDKKDFPVDMLGGLVEQDNDVKLIRSSNTTILPKDANMNDPNVKSFADREQAMDNPDAAANSEWQKDPNFDGKHIGPTSGLTGEMLDKAAFPSDPDMDKAESDNDSAFNSLTLDEQNINQEKGWGALPESIKSEGLGPNEE